MKAIQIQATGGPEVLNLNDVVTPAIKPDEVLVKIKASGVNFIDVYFREGRYPATLPLILGQEAAGEVVSTGAEVKSWKPGDRVVYAGVQGSYAEFAAVPASRLVRVPDDLSLEDAAAVFLQGLTAHYLAHSTYAIKKGDVALVHAAAGGTGLLLVQVAKKLGAQVIGTVSTEAKAQLAKDAGADHVILYAKDDFEVEVKRITEGRGVEVVYDSVGLTTFDQSLNCLRPRGYMVLYGASSGAVPPFDPMLLSRKGSLVLARPTLAHYVSTPEELRERAAAVFELVRSKALRVSIGSRYPLSAARQAHTDLQSRKTTGKLLLVNDA